MATVFLELHIEADGNKLLLNAEYISSVQPYPDKGSVVTVGGDSENFYVVREGYEEIHARMKAGFRSAGALS